MLCDISTGTCRPVVPFDFCKPVFNALHSLSHPGPKPSTRLVPDRFVWNNMKRDVRRWCSECLQCQKSKITRHTRAPVEIFPAADRRFGSLHVDLVGPLPPSEDYCFLLTIVDRFSRWPEAFPLRDISSLLVCRAFLQGWVARFRIPDHVVTNRGAQFTGITWKELLGKMGITFSTTTA